MCGLFGVFNFQQQPLTPEQLEVFKELAVLNNERGPVSAGMVEFSPVVQQSYLYNHQYWLGHLKRDVDNLILEPYALLGHCRAPTSGSNEWVQPFRTKGKHGNSYFAHNGLILDIPKLRTMSGITETNLIDSHYLHQLFVNKSDELNSTDITSFLSSFDVPGSYTFWWAYAGNLMLARNQGTLYISINNTSLTFSSIQHESTPRCLDDGEFIIITDKAYNCRKFTCENPLL